MSFSRMEMLTVPEPQDKSNPKYGVNTVPKIAEMHKLHSELNIRTCAIAISRESPYELRSIVLVSQQDIDLRYGL